MEPKGPPPSYDEASSSSAPSHLHSDTASLESSGIPTAARRSMEDELRELPTGWVRQYDAKTHHQFFVDASADPPRSIWHHPYDDEQYLASISPSERARIQNLHHHPQGDFEPDRPGDYHHKYPELPPRPGQSGEKKGFGRKLKDKLTHSTHEEREVKRLQQEEEERRLYEHHQKVREAMSKAAQTGVPQFLGKDRDGRDVYVEPPNGPGGAPYGGGGFGQDAYGYNPYTEGPYANPNARFVRPPDPYSRPYGGRGMYGGGMYGGGMGMGMMPLMGGLGGGMMMGGMMF